MEDFIQFVIEEIPEKKKRGRPRKNKKTDLEGDGWIGDKLTAAKKLAQKGVRKVGSVVLGKERAERIERYGDATLFLSKLPLPPSVKEYLRKYGDEVISKATIVRNPVQKLLTGAMNAVSLGSFGKKFGRLPYDDLFHLQLWVTTPSGVFGIEKNEVITMTFNPKPAQNAEFKEVSVPADLTMNKLMLGSEKIQGDKWTRYDAYSNNCQDFVMSLLKGSGMGNEGDYQFVKQDTDSLFKNDSFLRKFSRSLTNIGASVSTALSGVDDKPISSTKSSDTFEIPSPTDTDIQEVPTGGARGRKLPAKAVKGQRTISQWEADARRIAEELANPSLFTRVQELLDARRRGEVDANFNVIVPPTPPTQPDGSGMVKRGRGRPRKMVGGYTDAQIKNAIDNMIDVREGLLRARGVTTKKLANIKREAIQEIRKNPTYPLTIESLFDLFARLITEY